MHSLRGPRLTTRALNVWNILALVWCHLCALLISATVANAAPTEPIAKDRIGRSDHHHHHHHQPQRLTWISMHSLVLLFSSNPPILPSSWFSSAVPSVSRECAAPSEVVADETFPNFARTHLLPNLPNALPPLLDYHLISTSSPWFHVAPSASLRRSRRTRAAFTRRSSLSPMPTPMLWATARWASSTTT
jgi:hypothetical protein